MASPHSPTPELDGEIVGIWQEIGKIAMCKMHVIIILYYEDDNHTGKKVCSLAPI